MFHFIRPVIKFYNEWNVQCFVLISLSLQTIQTLCEPFRKRTRDWKLHFMFFSAHLLADWVASLTIGIIYTSPHHSLKPEILALWASFMLLHLGGSDTMTTSPLENSTLWLKYLVGFLNQVAVTFLVFTQFLSNNKLRVSSIILFVLGTIKYVKRTYVAYHMSRDKFRESLLPKPDPGPDYAKFMEEYVSQKEANLPTKIEEIQELNEDQETGYPEDEGKLHDLQVVATAFRFYEIFKGLIVDLKFSFRECEKSRKFFLGRDSTDAFSVLATELNFMYEVLYTRFAVLSTAWGIGVRNYSPILVIAACSEFFSFLKRDPQGLRHIDRIITITLFFGSLFFQVIALYMMALSDWYCFVVLKESGLTWLIVPSLPITRIFMAWKRTNWEDGTKGTCVQKAKRMLFRRWSESLQTYNLIDYSLKERSQANLTITKFGHNLLGWLGLKDFYDRMIYVPEKPIPKELWDSIFNELKIKSSLASDPSTAKESNWNDESSTIKYYASNVDYDQRVLIWHIATDLCYTIDEFSINEPLYQQNCKILSDYMLYLLLMHPTMMLTITGSAHIRFRDTCAEAKNFFNRKYSGNEKQENEHKWACKMILAVNTEVKPVNLKGYRSKSVLFDGCILAKELNNLDRRKKWKLMNEMWMKLLFDAASHCKGSIHGIELNKGGELLTFVWLLMVHLGLGDCFQSKEGNFRAKLVVGK